MAQLQPNIDRIYKPNGDYHLIQDTAAQEAIATLTQLVAEGTMSIKPISKAEFIAMLVLYNSNTYQGYTEVDVQKALHTIWLLPQEPAEIIHKGILGDTNPSSPTYNPAATVNDLPHTGYLKGWQYDVITAGTYAGISCVVGDSIVAVRDYAAGTASNADWAKQTVASLPGDGDQNDNNVKDEWLLTDDPTQMTGYIKHEITAEIIGTTETELEGFSKIGHTHDLELDKHDLGLLGNIAVQGLSLTDEPKETGETLAGSAHHHSINPTKKSLVMKALAKKALKTTTTNKNFTTKRITSTAAQLGIDPTLEDKEGQIANTGTAGNEVYHDFEVDNTGGLRFIRKYIVVEDVMVDGDVTGSASVVNLDAQSGGTQFVTGLTQDAVTNGAVVVGVDVTTDTLAQNTPDNKKVVTGKTTPSTGSDDFVEGLESGETNVVTGVSQTENENAHTHKFKKQIIDPNNSGYVAFTGMKLAHAHATSDTNTVTTYGDDGSTGGGGGGGGGGGTETDYIAKALMAYVSCSSAASAQNKSVDIPNWTEFQGGDLKIKMTNKNTAASGVKLKITNGSSDLFIAPLRYNGAAVTATNTWNAGDVLQVYYNQGSSQFEAYSLSGVLDQVTEDDFNAIFND